MRNPRYLGHEHAGRSPAAIPAPAPRQSAEIIYLERWRKFRRSPEPQPEPVTLEHWLIGLVMAASFAGAILALL